MLWQTLSFNLFFQSPAKLKRRSDLSQLSIRKNCSLAAEEQSTRPRIDSFQHALHLLKIQHGQPLGSREANFLQVIIQRIERRPIDSALKRVNMFRAKRLCRAIGGSAHSCSARFDRIFHRVCSLISLSRTRKLNIHSAVNHVLPTPLNHNCVRSFQNSFSVCSAPSSSISPTLYVVSRYS